MFDSVLNFLRDILGEYFVLGIIIAGCVIYLTIKITRWFTLNGHKLDNLPCDKHAQFIENMNVNNNDIKVSLARIEERSDSMNKRFESIEERFGKIEGRIDMMQNSVVKVLEGRGRHNDFTQAHSPISLTDLGKQKAEELKLDNIISKNWETISNIINEDKNPYDIQSAFIINFISTPEKYIDKESLDLIKNDAFLSGNMLIDYMRMIAVMARDRYFKEHDIEIGEVDKHDPSKQG